MANPPKSASYLKQLVSAARAIVTYQVGLPVGCVRVNKILHWLKPHTKTPYPVFEQYLKAATELPISSERLNWNREALRKADKQLEIINQKFRDQIFETCYEIIDLYGKTN